MTGMQLYRRLLSYALKYKTALLVAAAFMPLASLGEVGVVYITKMMMDEGFVGKNPQILITAPVGLVLVILARGAAGIISQWSLSWTGRRVIYDIRNQLFERMVRLPTTYYDHHPSSSLISKLIYDVEQLANATTNSIFAIGKDGLTVISLLAWMGYMSWKLTLILLIVSPITAVIVRRVSGRLRKVSKNLQDSMGGIVKITQEATAGHRIIKAFTAQDYETEKFQASNNHNRQQAMKQRTIQTVGTPIIEFIASIAVATVIYVALYETMHNQMSVGEFTSYLSSMMLLLAPAKRLTNTNLVIQSGLAASQSAFSVLDEEPEDDTGTLAPETISGRIEYQHVCFSYPSSSRRVLDDVSFIIEPGTMVALVGASGSGKTTIANLLPRFYGLEQGEILIDGNNIGDFQLTTLRKHISVIGQETILFDDTIANNICYGQEPDAIRLQHAAKAAHVMEFSEKMPKGLQTMVGEKGLRLSGGQRQRIAIARAIYKDAPILVMDEATSALDTESERHIQDALEVLMKNRSTLVIAHRLSTVEKANKILVMADGRIVEQGSHRELVSLDGSYSKLYQMQFSDTATK